MRYTLTATFDGHTRALRLEHDCTILAVASAFQAVAYHAQTDNVWRFGTITFTDEYGGTIALADPERGVSMMPGPNGQFAVTMPDMYGQVIRYACSLN